MVGRPGPGNRGGAGAPGLAAGAALGGLGAPKGPVRGLAVVAGVPAQARRKHLRVSTRWALPAGNRRDRNFGALWQRGEGAPAWTPPGGPRGGSGDAPAHPSGGQGLGDAPSARASRGGRPRGTRRGRGDTCPKTPAPPPTCPAPPPIRPRPCRPRPAPRPRGSRLARPGPASPSPRRLRPARGLPRPGRASPGRRRRRPGAGARSSPLRCGRRCRYRGCRYRCRCRGLRSRRRLHCSGDIVPLNRSPRRPAPPARRRDLSATALPRRHDGEVWGAPRSPLPPVPPGAGGWGVGQQARAMLGVARLVTLKGLARPENPGRGSITTTILLSCCP